MVSVGRHQNITLLSYSQVESVSGYVGNFEVRVRKKARYVKEETCTGCGTCVEKCPWRKIPSEFDLGLGTRPAIYFSFGQAVPRIPVIDTANCAYFQKGKCRACEKFCLTGSIDFEQQDELLDLEVGTIILATGFKDFDARGAPGYGYGVLDNVLTGMEFERLVNSGGPTLGKVTLKDGRTPQTIAILHCVGSRQRPVAGGNGKQHEYCSRVCCMYSLKLAHLIKERTEAEIYNFYIDIRAPGKAFEEFYNRVAEEGTHFIRGKVADVFPEPNGAGRLIVQAEDTLLGMVRKIPVDMVVLGVGLEAKADAQEVRRLFNLSCSAEGWFLERHPKLAPVSTFTDGVFLAGCCQGPKDIPDTVAQAGAAAAEALALIDAGHIEMEPNTAYILEEACSGCKTCIPLCPYSAISYREAEKTAAINEALCKGCGTCVASCPSGSIRQNLFEDEEIFQEIEGVLEYA